MPVERLIRHYCFQMQQRQLQIWRRAFLAYGLDGLLLPSWGNKFVVCSMQAVRSMFFSNEQSSGHGYIRSSKTTQQATAVNCKQCLLTCMDRKWERNQNICFRIIVTTRPKIHGCWSVLGSSSDRLTNLIGLVICIRSSHTPI